MKEYSNDRRFQQTLQGEAVKSEYDFDSDDVNDPYMRNVECIDVRTLNLAVAQVTPLELIVPSRALQFFDYTTSDATKAPTGTSVVYASFNDPNNPQATLRYKRGFNGTFSRVYLTWPAQAGLSAELWFLKSNRIPWMLG